MIEVVITASAPVEKVAVVLRRVCVCVCVCGGGGGGRGLGRRSYEWNNSSLCGIQLCQPGLNFVSHQ